MYAGMNARNNSSNAERDDIPEWKRALIMKKRSSHPGEETQNRSNFRGPVSPAESAGHRVSGSGASDSLPASHANKFSMLRNNLDENEKPVAEGQPETVIRTIGNIKVELRSVYKAQAENGAEEEYAGDRFLTSPLSEPVYPDSEGEEDLPYGPGIVDRLRAKFLNLGLKNRRNPAVRKFSSLENLSGGSGGMFRASGLQYRGERRLGARSVACGNPSQRLFPCSNFKKAQSMETLLVGGNLESNPFPGRRANARIFARGSRDKILSPVSRFTDSAPRFDGKNVKRVEYCRQGSAPNINEDELPKPDTVKHFKRIFESTPTEKPCHVPVNQTVYEKVPHNRTASVVPATAKTGDGGVSPKKPKVPPECDANAKSGAKITLDQTGSKFHNGPANGSESYVNRSSEELTNFEASQFLSPQNALKLEISREPHLFITSPTISEEPPNHLETDADGESANTDQILSEEEEEESLVHKVTPERLPLTFESLQGSQVCAEPEPVERSDCVTTPCEEPCLEVEEEGGSSPTEMVIASSGVAADEVARPTLRKQNWQKPPPATTSIVFDFRNKDVKPQISLNPAPFGCKPAKVKKRAGSPPRGDSPTPNGDFSSDEDEEDWDEMDIGADLPAISGIVFAGANVKVGRGSLLEKRNKKLTIQFNDEATSTYEYPCESPSPLEENGHAHHMVETNLRPLKSSTAINSSGLSNYTPHVISNEEFELGVSPPPLPIHRRLPEPKVEAEVDVTDAIVPADPDDSSGWSSAETADILF